MYHPSQALTAVRELRSLMYGVPPPHSILEEDSRYPRNALGIRMATYWLLNTWEYLNALLKTSAPEDAGEIATSRGLELYASLSLSHTGATVRDMGQRYLHRPYM